MFSQPFAQRAVLELLLLSAGAGLMGTWIVLRGLAFYAHAVAAAAFPGLVLAAGLSFPPLLGALGAGAVVTVGVGSGRGRDASTALALVAALVVGVILASDVFHSGSEVDTLLFGSLFAVSGADLVFAAAASVAALAATLVLGPRWLATGFDGGRGRFELVLLGFVGVVSIASLAAVGALLATALLVVPAATARLWTRRLVTWQLAAIGLAAAEGMAAVWLAVHTNAPPGATLATLSGAVFAVSTVVASKRD